MILIRLVEFPIWRGFTGPCLQSDQEVGRLETGNPKIHSSCETVCEYVNSDEMVQPPGTRPTVAKRL